MLTQVPDAFIFMKVGNHAGESFQDIIRRKQQEYERSGYIFWGYGGSACHPLTQVQPFIKLQIRQQGSVYLLMQPVHSLADPDILPAQEYSQDGIIWNPIPDGISVTGSRYALVLDEISPTDLVINTTQFEVAIGPSRGKNAQTYLQGRTDKACLLHKEKLETNVDDKESASRNYKDIKLAAKLMEPYAVLLR